MTDTDLFRVLVALLLLLVSARVMARLFTRLRLPPVIGEIVGGLLLGPTMLGTFAPGAVAWLFPKTGPVAAATGLVYQFGMLLLMFLAGAEMRTVFSRGSKRTVVTIALTGMVIPFAFGLLLARVVDLSSLLGPAANAPALTLIIAVAIAVTSIPVISRIMMDLGIMNTSFARVVVSVAVLEDIVLNVIIAVAVGMVRGTGGGSFGAVSVLGIDSRAGATAYHSAATVLFLAVSVGIALAWRRWRGRGHGEPRAAAAVAIGSVGSSLVLLLGVSGLCVFLGIAPILGAFVVGLLTGGRVVGSPAGADTAAIRGFASAFFIPIYFAVIGVNLDLINSFDLGLTLLFIGFACVVKVAGVYLGARLSGSRRPDAVNLSFALNARGGPGLVLAAVAHDAGIVSDTFFTTLVLTAVITSLMAGWWLQTAVARKPIHQEVEECQRTVSS